MEQIRVLIADDHPLFRDGLRTLLQLGSEAEVVGEAATESREVSSRGLYFHLPKGLKSGSPVEIVMTLPHELTQAGPVRVRCLGRVLRSSPEHSGDMGVAAAIERYEFMRSNENESAA